MGRVNCVILCGHKSSGKSYFGNLLAQKIACEFIDTDKSIEMLYAKRYLKSFNCGQIVQHHDERFFRALECEVIQNFQVENPSVIAIGGGTLLDEKNRLQLHSLGCLVFLRHEKEVIKERIFKNGIPSFFDPHYPELYFEKMFQLRELIYSSAADVIIDLFDKTDQQVVQELEMLLSMNDLIK